MKVISVIVGSTREGRFSEKPATWILQHLKKREGVDARLLDLREFPMPFFDQPVTPATPGRPAFEHEVVRKWTAAIAQSDGFVFVNAGIPNLAPFGKITEEHYDSVFNGNVKGLLFTVQKSLPLMPDGACILNASIVASKGLPDWSVYSATKAAVRSFARTWTTDLKDRRIRVNAVSPGFTDTAPWHCRLSSLFGLVCRRCRGSRFEGVST